jgi:DUF4097 and DUF4098 domain-containing protein YvlB
MKTDTKIISTVVVVVVTVLLIGTYVFLKSDWASLEQSEKTDVIPTAQNVEVQATTYNGNIEIQASTSNQIEVTYKIEAPKGHLNEISTSTTNQTLNPNTLVLVAEAKLNAHSELTVNHNAKIIIKLPSTSHYDLTLHTLNGDITKPQLNDTMVVCRTDNGNINIEDDNATSIDAVSQNGNVQISLVQGTLFNVDANAANGNISYQGIAMNTSMQTQTQFKGNTSSGIGNMSLTLSAENGNITIEYYSK